MVIRLVVRDAAAGTRAMLGNRLEANQADVERPLLEQYECEFPKWSRSLAAMLAAFEDWLASAFYQELKALSECEREAFLKPLAKVCNQAFHALQQFRARLSERTEQVFGLPLSTIETAIVAKEPDAPDIRVGRVFDPELGTALAGFAGLRDPAGGSPPFCANRFVPGLSEPGPVRQTVEGEFERRALGCSERGVLSA